MDKNYNSENIDEVNEIIKIIDGRNKIILHNNLCIIETISFYEMVLLNDIIEPFLFNENYTKIPKIAELFSERLSFMDKYKIVCKIAKEFDVDSFKQFDDYIKLRNRIAHNLSSVINIDTQSKESEINFAGEAITWTEYKKTITEWAHISFDMANFILKVFDKVNNSNHAIFVYCKTINDCVLVQHNLIYPEIEGEYTSFFKTGFNMDLLEPLKKEHTLSENNDT